MAQRHDCDDIKSFLATIPDTAGLRGDRRYWPRFLYHITDVQNAARIIGDGLLLSRNRAVLEGRMSQDNASPEVIERTRSWVHGAARMFFRPRTPTFFNNEGIRPNAVGERGSHCAVPIAFLFDSASVLCLNEATISEGGLARHNVRTGSGIEFLRSLPFNLIFDDAAMRGDKSEAIFRRHAEVVVNDALPLEPHLRLVFSRSEAERQTLVSLTEQESPSTTAAYRSRFRVNEKPTLFFKRWAHVESVTASGDFFTVRFNPTVNPVDAGPFVIEMTAIDLDGGGSWTAHMADRRTDRPAIFRIRGSSNRRLLVTIRMDGCVTYRHTFDPLSHVIV